MVVVLLAISSIYQFTMRRPAVARLVALAPEDARIVEPRLSGGFAWRAYRGPMRVSDPAGEAAPDHRQLRLSGAAGELAERAARDESADAQPPLAWPWC